MTTHERMSKTYFAPLVTKPVIVLAPGQYKTRCGETVTVEEVDTRHTFGCVGAYSDGTRERWHKSGRILATSATQNDIIGRA